MAGPADYPIAHWTAEFADPRQEDAFREATHLGRVRQIQWAFGLAAPFYLSFAITDYFAVSGGERYTEIFLTRILVSVLGLTVALTARRQWRLMVDGVTPTLVVFAAMVGFLSITLLRPYDVGWHGMSMMVMLLGTYLFIPNRFLPVVILAVSTSLVFIWLMLQYFSLSSHQVGNLALLLFGMNLFGTVSAHRISCAMREQYRDAAVLREANERLEHEIETRRKLEADLRDQALRDELTGLANRRRFFEWAPARLAEVECAGDALSLILVDIDYFRQINETYSHVRGDELLRRLARLCESHLPPGGMVARLSGEEFVMFMPAVSLEAAREIADRLRLVAQNTPVRALETSLHFTISLGVVQARADENLGTLLRRGDEALRQAKYAGRNRVHLAA